MNPFTTALVKAPKRARFDFSHDNTVGMRVGCLTPTLSEFIVPGDEVSMSMEQICRLAPMPVPTFTPLKVRHDFFFVPLRLMYGNDYLDKLFGSSSADRLRAHVQGLDKLYSMATDFYSYPFGETPGWRVVSSPTGRFPVPGTLMDYLGYPVLSDRNGGLDVNALQDISTGDYSRFASFLNQNFDVENLENPIASAPRLCFEKFIAYHYIWRDWYRFTGIETNTIVEPYLANGILSRWNEVSQFVSNSAISSIDPLSDFSSVAEFVMEDSDGEFLVGDLFRFRLAHLVKDMFMSARYGNKPTVLIPTGANGTIPALREASAIQRFLDLISITGQRYFDKVRGLFGVEPQGPKDDRVQFLARYQQFIKVGEVVTTASTDEAVTGDYAGRGILIDGKYLFKRRFTEHGYLFCISSVIPEIAYNGLGRDITDIHVLDTPVPSLAEVGDQSILNREVHFDFNGSTSAHINANNESFGDQFRYYAYKSHNNEVHGFFLMDTASPWSPLLPVNVTFHDGTRVHLDNVISVSKVYPSVWNQIFNDVSDEPIFGDRFFFNLNFTEYITRALPKYINYHL